MALQDYELLGADGATASKKNLKVVGYVVCAAAASVMFVAVIGGLNTSNAMAPEVASGASGPVELWAGASPSLRARAMPSLQLEKFGIRPSPLSNLAVSAIEACNRDYRGDVSARATSEWFSGLLPAKKERVSGWSLVDADTKRKLLRVLDEVEARRSLLAGVSVPASYFDPLGFATTVSGGKLLFYREVELKHGRIAMLAALGMLVGEQWHPLFGGDIDVPAYVAFQATPLQNFWPAVVTAIAIPEIFSVTQFQDPSKGEQWAMKLDHEPGDLGFDPLGLKPKDEKELVAMKTKELNNGRLAMIAAAGMIAQELVTGQKLF
jgi:hypothetical protein